MSSATTTRGTGKTHLAIAISIRACLAGQRVQFATATQWVARLGEAKRQNGLDAELRRLSFIPLIVVDEIGYIPFDPRLPTSCSASSRLATSAPP
jgi:DNA replication protein DnaC